MLRSWRLFPHGFRRGHGGFSHPDDATCLWRLGHLEPRCKSRHLKGRASARPWTRISRWLLQRFFLDFLLWKNREIMGNPIWRELLNLIFNPIYHGKLNHPLPHVFFVKPKTTWSLNPFLEPSTPKPTSRLPNRCPPQKTWENLCNLEGYPPYINTNSKRPPWIMDGWKRNLASTLGARGLFLTGGFCFAMNFRKV